MPLRGVVVVGVQPGVDDGGDVGGDVGAGDVGAGDVGAGDVSAHEEGGFVANNGDDAIPRQALSV